MWENTDQNNSEYEHILGSHYLQLFLKVQRLYFGQLQVSFTQDAQGYFEIVWLLPL